MATMGERLTRGKAIRKFCLECAGDAQKVKQCTASNCPLYRYRLGHEEKTEKTDDAIRIDS